MADNTKKLLFSKKDIELAGKAVKYGMRLEQVADLLGVSRKTFFRRIDDQPELADTLKKYRAEGFLAIANSLHMQAISGKNTAATIFAWKVKGGTPEWGELEPIENLDRLEEEFLRMKENLMNEIEQLRH